MQISANATEKQQSFVLLSEHSLKRGHIKVNRLEKSRGLEARM